MRIIQLVVDGGEEYYICIRGEGVGTCGVTSIMIRPKKGLRSVPSVLCICPLNDSLVSFMIIMLTNEFCPLVFSRTYFYGLEASIPFLVPSPLCRPCINSIT